MLGALQVKSMSLTEHAADPLISLLDEMLLLPMPVPMRPQSSRGRQSPGESSPRLTHLHWTCTVRGLAIRIDNRVTRKSPIDYDSQLPRCPYRMMSYRVEDVDDVDPAFGVQLHNPRFLECIGAPESARLLGHSTGQMGPNNGSAGRHGGNFGVTVRCWPYGFEYAGVGSVHDVAEPDVVRGAPLSLRTGNLPGTNGQRRGPDDKGAPCGHPDGSHGIVAATYWSGWSRADHGVILQ